MIHKCTHSSNFIQSPSSPLLLRQAGTWDPLLQSLHLDKHLHQQQNTKKLWVTENNCVHMQLGQIKDNKIQKDQKPSCHFWRAGSKNRVLGAKAGNCACPLHTTLPNGWADHLSHSAGPTPGPAPTLTPCKEPPRPPRRMSRGTCYLFSLPPAAAGTPIKPCLYFLSGLLSISLD